MTDSIPSEIREKYKSLFNDVCHLHRKWAIFRQLFVSGEDIVELLKRVAPGFFLVCKDLLVDDVLLSISRLADPKQSFKAENLSLEQLVRSIDAGRYPDLMRELEPLFSVTRDKCAFAREQRNKRIAHTDLSTKLEATSLLSPTTTNVEAALESIRALMNAIEKYFHEPVYCNDVNIAFVDYRVLTVDGTQLITGLREAQANRNQASSRGA
jgi:hypothetical protein